MSDKDVHDTVRGISRRKALQSTVGLTGVVMGVSGIAAGDGDPDGQEPSGPLRDSEYILDEDYWRNDNGKVEFDHAKFDKWDVTVTDQSGGIRRPATPGVDQSSLPVPSGLSHGLNIHVGENKTSSISTDAVVQNAGSGVSSRPTTRPSTGIGSVRSPTMNSVSKDVMLVGGSIPDWVPGIGGTEWGIEATVTAYPSISYCYLSLTLEVGVTSVVLWSWGFFYDFQREFCTQVTPEDFPLEIESCLVVELDGDDLTLEGTYEICAPPDDPCWLVDCQFCGSGSLGDVDIELF